MRNSRLKRASVKQQVELAKRRWLKNELLEEYGRKCMTCGAGESWPPISLSHVIALSRGGLTDKSNCILECSKCHSLYEKAPWKREKGSYGYNLWAGQQEV